MFMFIGVDIGGSKICIARSAFANKIDKSIKISTPDDGKSAMELIISNIVKIAGKYAIDAIGVSAPGPLDLDRGMILRPTNLHWHNLNLTKPLNKAFGVPVILEHDATCGGLAEATYGSGKKYHYVQYITISTGIGSCFVIDKQPLKGKYNSEGGRQIIDINHHKFEKQIGSFEQIASGQAIKRKFGKIAAQIDPSDEQSWRYIAHNLSVGIYNFITINSPEIVVLGGGVSVHFDKFINYLKEYLEQYPTVYPLPPIVQAKYVETAPVLGTIMLASQKA